MKRTLIIAEAGINHNGNMDIAKEMIQVAKDTGADIVKFQTGKTSYVMSKFAQKAEYQKTNTGSEGSQLDMCLDLTLPYPAFSELADECKRVGITFLSTPFTVDSVEYLNNIEMPFWKIPSGEITHLPYLIAIAKTHKPVVMSTGMCTMEEIEEAVKVLRDNGTKELSLLHCNTEYPTPFEDVNLRAMETMRQRFNVEVGYSDHTKGIEVPIAAVAMGATIIEKHFTLDRSMPGPDQAASLEPDEFRAMTEAIRNIEKAFGDGVKKPSPSEAGNIEIARKSIVALRDIKKGELLTDENIMAKRPANGISPMKWFEVVGTYAIRDFSEDEPIEI
ncbi:MAG: N-acetylneuraminate synthase [Lachnospiraceae bacterium]|nr:N-acetylneuraminate synthase [Lachnospiraceae bacterium]